MDYNTKISEIEGKIHSITDLDTTAALTAVENKIPLVSSLVKKRKIMTQKYQILREDILLHLNIRNLRMICVMKK